MKAMTTPALIFLGMIAASGGCDQHQNVGKNLDAGQAADAAVQPPPADAAKPGSDAHPPPKDVKAPTVSLEASPQAVTLPGNVEITINATDEVGVKQVDLFVNGTKVETLNVPPYGAQRAVTAADNGNLEIYATARDEAGNASTSQTATVRVNIDTTPVSIPTFVAAGAPALISTGTSLTLSTPSGIQQNDFEIALIDAWEETGPRTLSPPAGWTVLGGFPIHNVNTAHPPFLIPANENHGTWIYSRFASASEPSQHAFVFTSSTMARGTILAYRSVDATRPIHDKSAMAFHGSGDTNGFGSGNTTLTSGRQVNLVATGWTDHPTYSVVRSSFVSERLNTGEQPNGLNLIVHDEPLSPFGFYTGPSIANKQSPSGSTDGFLWTFATLVLTPQ